MKNHENLPTIAPHPVCVLLAEDNLTFQRVLKMMLEKKGLQVLTANNGVQAVEQAQANNFDAVLMDINMPEMGGVEATCIIRQTQSLLPIFAFTAHDESYLSNTLEKDIFTGYVSKFATPDDIVKIIYDNLVQPLAAAV
jgi:two-component system, sensor histidine kinase and response regulator